MIKYQHIYLYIIYETLNYLTDHPFTPLPPSLLASRSGRPRQPSETPSITHRCARLQTATATDDARKMSATMQTMTTTTQRTSCAATRRHASTTTRRSARTVTRAVSKPWEETDCRLVLEDGSVWRGRSFGARATQVGEVVFNTSLSGYVRMGDGDGVG